MAAANAPAKTLPFERGDRKSVLRTNQIAAERAREQGDNVVSFPNSRPPSVEAAEYENATEGANNEQAYASALKRNQLAAKTYNDTLFLPDSFSPDIKEEFDEESLRLQQLEVATRNAGRTAGVNELGPLRGQLQQIADDQAKMIAKALDEELLRKAARWGAKIAGHSLPIGDSAALGTDGWVFGAIGYAYDLVRGVVTIFVQEPSEEDLKTKAGMARYLGKKTLLFLIPPYHPLREPGDFATFIFEALLAGIVLTIIVTIIVIIAGALGLAGATAFDLFSAAVSSLTSGT